MRYISEALDQYTGICKEALHDCASKLSKSFESVIIEVLLFYIVIPGKINFTGPLRQALLTVLPPELRSPSLEEPDLAPLQRLGRCQQCARVDDTEQRDLLLPNLEYIKRTVPILHFKGFGRRKLGFYQAHSRNKNPLHPSGFYALI